MEREYYFLPDAAKLAGFSEPDLIHFAANKKLNLCALLPDCMATEDYPCEAEDAGYEPPSKKLSGPFLIPSQYLRRHEAGATVEVQYVFEDAFFMTTWILDEPLKLSELRLVVMAEELNRKLLRSSDVEVRSPLKPPSDKKLVETIAALLAVWPKAKLPTGKDLEASASSIGVSITDDTIRKALNAAMEIAPSLRRD